jgi:site-specific DNA recombinase
MDEGDSGTDKPVTADIYCRLSLALMGDTTKVDEQEAICRKLAEAREWEVGAVHKDNSRSAWRKDRKRPGWDAMLDRIKAGDVQAIIVYHGDRLVRQPFDLETLLRLPESAGVQLASPTGTRDLSNADDLFVLRIEAAMACRESDNISRRVKAAVGRNVARGIPQPSCIRGYGYERDCRTIIPGEAVIIQEMADRILAGHSVRSIAAWLNEAGVPTVTGARWIPATVKSIATNPRIAGQRTLKGVVKGAGDWPAIIDLATVEAIRQVVAPVRRGRNPEAAAAAGRVHLLSGIARCASCRGGMRSMRRHDNRSSLVYMCCNDQCPGPKVVRSEMMLDEYVIAATLARLARPTVTAERNRARQNPQLARQVAELEQRMAGDRAKLKAIAHLKAYDPALAMGVIDSYKDRIAELRAQMETSDRERFLASHGPTTREEWDNGWPLEVRRKMIAALYTVTVLPSARRGPGFDPDCVVLAPVEEDE